MSMLVASVTLSDVPPRPTALLDGEAIIHEESQNTIQTDQRNSHVMSSLAIYDSAPVDPTREDDHSKFTLWDGHTGGVRGDSRGFDGSSSFIGSARSTESTGMTGSTGSMGSTGSTVSTGSTGFTGSSSLNGDPVADTNTDSNTNNHSNTGGTTTSSHGSHSGSTGDDDLNNNSGSDSGSVNVDPNVVSNSNSNYPSADDEQDGSEAPSCSHHAHHCMNAAAAGSMSSWSGIWTVLPIVLLTWLL
jgi:hypothetical protein